VIDALSHLVHRGETSNITNVLHLAKEILTQKAYGILMDIPRTILVIAAGSSDDSGSTLAQAELIKDEGIRILTVAVGPKVG